LVFAVTRSGRLLVRRGNIAMNAGARGGAGGTALDNLAWWRMVDPEAQLARGHAA